MVTRSLAAVASPHHNLAGAEIQVLDPDLQRLQQAKTAAVHEHGNQPRGTAESVRQGTDFFPTFSPGFCRKNVAGYSTLARLYIARQARNTSR